MVENNLQNISNILILRGSIRRPEVPDIVMKEFVGNRLLLTKFPNKKLIICEEPEFNLTEDVRAYYMDLYGVELTDEQIEAMYHPSSAAGSWK